MRIAIVGTGISGLTAAYLLRPLHDITVYEAQDRIGGHTATIEVNNTGERLAIDTGFIVYNNWTYPNFIRLLSHLGIQGQATAMGFSVSCRRTGLEYSGSSLNTLFAQRRNLLRPAHWRMLSDILRFNRSAQADLEWGALQTGTTLGEYLRGHGYSEHFIHHYLIPMGAAIWSAGTETMLNFPLEFFVRFFKNHGLLNINERPQWYVIPGGSRKYLGPLTASFQDRIRVATPVSRITRAGDKVQVQSRSKTRGECSETFDAVVIAAHSDQALQMLADASEAEREVLGAIPYLENDVILHTDISLLPRNRCTWSSWNYQLTERRQERPVLTYNMNVLQRLNAAHTYCVTLNHNDAVAPQSIIGRYRYAHPQFSVHGVRAQQAWGRINGVCNTWFCGAYWGNGFHEDGVNSALRVAEALGASLDTGVARYA